MTGTRLIKLQRAYNIRLEAVFEADVPVEMLSDSTYFIDGVPTSAFDQWMCDNGEQYEEEDRTPLDDDELEFKVISGGLKFP